MAENNQPTQGYCTSIHFSDDLFFKAIHTAHKVVLCCNGTPNYYYKHGTHNNAFIFMAPVVILVLEMFSVTNKSIMQSYGTYRICK